MEWVLWCVSSAMLKNHDLSFAFLNFFFCWKILIACSGFIEYKNFLSALSKNMQNFFIVTVFRVHFISLLEI